MPKGRPVAKLQLSTEEMAALGATAEVLPGVGTKIEDRSCVRRWQK